MRFAATLTAALALTTPAFAQDAPVLTEIAEGTYHFWSMGYSSLVVVGENGVLVTDTAFTPRAEVMKAAIAEITDLPVTHVALSHEHFDHVGGSEVFADAQVIAQEKVEDFKSLSPLMPFPEIDQTFDEVLTIDLGGISVDLKHIAVGDGVATTVVHIPANGTVFSVDMYEPEAFTVSEFKEDTNFIGVRDILNEMVSWDPTYAINGHSPGNSIDALKENAELMDKLYTAVLPRFEEAFASGDPSAPWQLLFAISGQVEMPEYASWEAYDTAFPAYVRRMALSIMHGG